METTSFQGSWDKTTPKLIAEHMRHPVHFEDAVKRIKSRYGPCTWVEAGFNSSVTTIARRCLPDVGSGNSDLFFPVNLSRKDSLTALADMTVSMWKNSHKVQFWPCHRDQRQEYDQIMLPPYESEKTRHWLEFDSEWHTSAAPCSKNGSEIESNPEPEPEPVLLTFQGFAVAGGSKQATFIVNPRCEEWKVLVAGHVVLQQPLCPAALYMELIARAARELATIQELDTPAAPTLRGLQMVSPLGLSSVALLEIILTPTNAREISWDFIFHSRDQNANGFGSPNCHAKGGLQISMSDEETSMEMSRTSRLFRPQCLADSLLREPGHEAVRGSVVYGVFSQAVQYHDFYRGVREVTSTQDGTLMAQVILPKGQPEAVIKDSLTNPVAIDNFLQVPGIYANCLAPCPSDEAYVCTGIEFVQFAAGAAIHEVEQHYDVYVISSPVLDKIRRHDVFALHHSSKEPIFIAQGVNFHRVRVSSLAKTLARTNKNESDSCVSRVADSLQSNPSSATDRAPVSSNAILPAAIERYQQQQDDLRRLLSDVADIPLHMIQGNVSLEVLGIDSLMATEIISAIGKVFGQNISQEKWRDLQTFASLCECLAFTGSPDQASSTPTGKVQHSPLETSGAAVLPESSPTASESTGYGLSNLTSVLRKLLATHLDCEPDRLTQTTNLVDAGLDSLLCIELIGDANKLLGVKVDLSQITMDSTFHHFVQIVVDAMHAAGLLVGSTTTPARVDSGLATLAGSLAEWESGACGDLAAPLAVVNYGDCNADLTNAPEAFESVKDDLQMLSDRNQLTGFYEKVMEKHSELVVSYTVEAFAALGVDLSRIRVGEEIPQIPVLPRHASLQAALYEILRDGEMANFDGASYLRSDKGIGLVPAKALFDNIVREFPQHAKDHQLLNLCGAELAELLSGHKDPLAVLFGSKQNRNMLEDYYSASPVHITMSHIT